ncbi:cytochrome P450 [Nocardioides mangrovi]|uniref:Cytochrome P450 n=1 Tax=Nocardioides mangrovi TaxID=2874580 RepID=A0ABS7UAS3_9ACTN|nr:cytochrome P450 [Nocardioides mangrovi]MBZ5738100.1 cytochrome P450 [Nocardioides mangrovi]
MATTSPVRELPPSPRGLPLIGRSLEYARDPIALFRKQWESYGAVSPMSMVGGDPWVMLLGPDACEVALRNADKAFANGPAWTYLVGPFFGRGLMFLDFEEHHLHRRIMQQAFTRDRLAGYVGPMHAAVAAGLAGWQPQDGFQAYWALKDLTLGIATETFMGGAEHTSAEEMARVNRSFIACVQAAAAIVRHDLPFTRWHRGMRGRRVLEDFVRGYLPSRRAAASDDLLSVLCHIESDEGERFTDDDVVNHVIFLMMAAHDTSTYTLSVMLEKLGQHQDWQVRCRAEVLQLAARVGDRPTLSDLDGLTSLDLVMKECLRLRAPVPVVLRRTVKDTVVLGTRVPADTYVTVAPQFSHLMPEYWTDPEAFDPERFGPERREDRSHRYAWEPFGGGVHKCLGMFFAGAEVTAFLFRFLQDFEWTVDPAYVAPLNHHSLPFPKDGQPIDLRRR